jgi:hypothetical protein
MQRLLIGVRLIGVRPGVFLLYLHVLSFPFVLASAVAGGGRDSHRGDQGLVLPFKPSAKAETVAVAVLKSTTSP